MAEGAMGGGPGPSGELGRVDQATHLIDSDVVIWALRGDAPTVRMLSDLAADADVRPACSAVTIFEVEAGMRPREEPQVRALLGSMACLGVGAAVAQKAAEYYRSFRAVGKTLHIADLLIAGTAFCHGIALVTYNSDDYPMEDIRLYDAMPPAPSGEPRR